MATDKYLSAPISSNITNATVTGGAVDGNQVFLSMDRQPPIALRTLGARAHITDGYHAPISAEPVPCATCGGEGVVDEGVLTHSDGGIEYEWPIKCVKDCPTCKAAPPAPVSTTINGIPEIEHLHTGIRNHQEKLAQVWAEYDAYRQAHPATPVSAEPRHEVEAEEDAAVIHKLATILAGVCVALKGEELPLHRHSYHDIVEVAQTMKLELDLYRMQAANTSPAPAAPLSDAKDAVPPMRGHNIKQNRRHDAGAYARCSYCGRYSDNPDSLDKETLPCDCGKLHGWCGSFKKPTDESIWSNALIVAKQTER